MVFLHRDAGADHFISNAGFILGSLFIECGWQVARQMESEWESVLAVDIVLVVPGCQGVAFLNNF